MESKITGFLRELIIVVLGILIALFINNWNEDIQHQRFIDKTLYAIGNEIKASKADIEDGLPKHRRIVDSLFASTYDDTETVRDVFVNVEGLQIPEIKNIGLRFFITYNAELVEYEMIADLSEIEFLSDGFRQKMDKLFDLGYDEMDSTAIESKAKVAQLLADVIDDEEGLLELYEEFIEKYASSLERFSGEKE